ncbi:hypothetical protein SCMU_11650 [Sinomonas cyclohexanicum]|uniref:Uncharacterized protein n=1 Tax=Sinomonas cyclohexanicum TaxID=322009 RepID=A0ABM7PSV8_SINCY|nr:hypothetical protein [Corynebacterium cyclohexanicum]BCT75323.1 hypothetical protein SCMU_11650 [Corynebacterium cyclohexanicum]
MVPHAVTPSELRAETALLLPERDTLLTININIAPIVGVNLAFAINAATIGSTANAGAWQNIVSWQRN